jgi:hypothetical protein
VHLQLLNKKIAHPAASEQENFTPYSFLTGKYYTLQLLSRKILHPAAPEQENMAAAPGQEFTVIHPPTSK